MATKQFSNMPLFRLYTVSELAELTPYKESYLLRVKEGRTPLNWRFRETVAKILRRSEVELFGEDENNPTLTG